jgi:hypothetical protein
MNSHIARHSPEPDIVALDGVYAEDKKGCVCFRPAPPPSNAEVARVADRVHRSIARLFERRGLGQQVDPDPGRFPERDLWPGAVSTVRSC